MAEVPTKPLDKPAETVVVGCKLPSGLRLRLFQKVDVDYPMYGGGVKRTPEYHPTGDEIVIRGNSYEQDKGPRHPINDFGYAITENVPKSFMDTWMSQNAKSNIVASKLVIVARDLASLTAESRENEGRVTGFERLNPDALPKELSRIETAKTGDRI